MKDFKHFLSSIPHLSKIPLPGEDAHRKLSPPERSELIRNINFDVVKPNRAAVMIVVYPRATQCSIALIKRTCYVGVHAAQIALPGGKLNHGESTLAAALRETYEEIGIPQCQIKVIRELSALYIPPSNFLVSPFLGYVEQTPDFLLNGLEVAQLIELSVADLLNDLHLKTPLIDTSYSKSVKVPAFVIKHHTIWGATAMILNELKQVLQQVK